MNEADRLVPVMETPLALHLAGADLLPIRIGVRTLAKILKGKHYGAISPSLLKQIPEVLADPVMLLKLKPTKTRPENSIVAMLNLYDSRGNTINVSVSLNRKTGSNAYELNEISSVFGREFPDGKGPNYAWFLNEAAKSYVGEDGRTERQLKYLNKEKISRWAGQTGQEMPTGQLIGRLDQSIPAEEDLVKLKTQKPEHYSLPERDFGTQDNRGTDQIEKGNLRYIDKQKSSAWDTLSGQKPSDGTNLSTWMLKQNFSEQNIHTEEDLVKAREQSRTRYSLTQKPSGAPQK